MKVNTLILTALAVACVSCSTPQLAYFQGTYDGQTIAVKSDSQIKLRPDDQISIIVTAKTPELSALFNLPVTGYRVGASNVTSALSQNSNQVSLYTLDQNGDIDFPVIGTVNIGGMTRNEVAETIKSRLQAENLVKDPVVTVEFSNLAISVLGEVTKPGRYAIDKDRMTILDAIGKAGDLTINGRRDNVTLFRKENGKETAYNIDLRDAQQMMSSPVYTLQQDDIIYVTPTKKKMRESTVNGNTTLSASFWVSLSSLGVTIATLIMNCIN